MKQLANSLYVSFMPFMVQITSRGQSAKMLQNFKTKISFLSQHLKQDRTPADKSR